jgi:hypothetical protein
LVTTVFPVFLASGDHRESEVKKEDSEIKGPLEILELKASLVHLVIMEQTGILVELVSQGDKATLEKKVTLV